MAKNDATKFFNKIDCDGIFASKIAHSRNEAECLKIIADAGMHFTAQEFHQAFHEKYHHPLKKEILHRLSQEGIIPSEVSTKIPYQNQSPHHGE